MVIRHWVVLNNSVIKRDGKLLPLADTAEDLYRAIGSNYPKFFKMDKLCKWAFAASELLLDQGKVCENSDKNRISLALATNHGCLDVDKRYFETIDMPSPALFVYTLPNIMLGEICIRNGFKGEQVCMVSDEFDAAEIHFAASNFLADKNMDACLCGWVDASADKHEIALFWVAKEGTGYAFTPQNMQELSHTVVR